MFVFVYITNRVPFFSSILSHLGDEDLLSHHKPLSLDPCCSSDSGQTPAGGSDED